MLITTGHLLALFAITEAESELLAVVEQLAEPANDSQLHPDKKTLHRVLVG